MYERNVTVNSTDMKTRWSCFHKRVLTVWTFYILCAQGEKAEILWSVFLGHASLQRGSKLGLFLVLFIYFHLITDGARYPGLSKSLLSLRPSQWLWSTGK